MADKDAMLRRNIGGASFQLIDYGARRTPIFKDDKLTGYIATVRGRGEITAASAAALASNIAAVSAAFRDNGFDFRIYAHNVLEFELLAASSTNGGPFADNFDVLPQLDGDGEPLVKRIDFAISSQLAPRDDDSDDSADDARKVTTTTRPDQLREIEYVGTISRVDAQSRWKNVQLPKLLQPYPANKWVPSVQAVLNATGNVLEYRVAFVELVQPIPANYLPDVIDFEFTYAEERNDQERLTETRTYNVLVGVNANIVQVRDKLRPGVGTVVLAERFNYTNYHERRLQVEFVILRSGSGDALLDFEQKLELDRESNPVRAIRYEGLRPVLLSATFPVYTARQSGRAVGLQGFLKAPDGLFEAKYQSDTPKVSYRRINAVEWETTWSYAFVSDSAFKFQPADFSKLARPKPTPTDFIAPPLGAAS